MSDPLKLDLLYICTCDESMEVEEFKKRFDFALTCLPAGASSVKVTLSTSTSYDESYGQLYVEFLRPKTAAELAEEERRARRVIDHERAQYERLKKKFEPT